MFPMLAMHCEIVKQNLNQGKEVLKAKALKIKENNKEKYFQIFKTGTTTLEERNLNSELSIAICMLSLLFIS